MWHFVEQYDIKVRTQILLTSPSLKGDAATIITVTTETTIIITPATQSNNYNNNKDNNTDNNNKNYNDDDDDDDDNSKDNSKDTNQKKNAITTTVC